MKNGSKDFTSEVMDKIGIEPYFENRLNDIQFAQVMLCHANARGHLLEETVQLTQELYEYIHYLYSHIEQLEKDKQDLAKRLMKVGKQ